MADSIVPFRSPSSQPTRRAALAALAAAPVVGLPVAAGATGTEDPHVAWAREAEALIDRVNVGDLSEAQVDLMMDRASELQDLIATTPSTTLVGACAQVAFVAESILHNQPGEVEDAALENALATLERLAEEGRV